jgi:uncharacterized membrane protein
MSATASASAPPRVAQRLASIDLIRGAVMILMAIDHVRVFAGVPAGGPTVGLFFTRWVTHFCAPAFLFLAGTSAFFYGKRHADLARFLVTRGAWLVLLELTVLRLAWTFNGDFVGYNMAGVIWVIGWCMILMAALVRLPVRAVGILGVAVIVLHDAVMGPLVSGLPLWLRSTLYVGFFEGPFRIGANGPSLIVLYSLVPWIGVMAAGYGFGALLDAEPARRNRLCLTIGIIATAAFVVLRGFNLYGDPRPWGTAPGDGAGPPMPALLSFLNTAKYPASLLFLLMTLGPTIALIPLLERARGRVADAVTVFGRVPFFYYVLHIPLIHAMALVVSRLKDGAVSPWLFANHPMGSPPPPDGYTWSLALLYICFAVTIVLLYPLCRWFAGVKARRGEWWLSYL